MLSRLFQCHRIHFLMPALFHSYQEFQRHSLPSIQLTLFCRKCLYTVDAKPPVLILLSLDYLCHCIGQPCMHTLPRCTWVSSPQLVRRNNSLLNKQYAIAIDHLLLIKDMNQQSIPMKHSHQHMVINVVYIVQWPLHLNHLTSPHYTMHWVRLHRQWDWVGAVWERQ